MNNFACCDPLGMKLPCVNITLCGSLPTPDVRRVCFVVYTLFFVLCNSVYTASIYFARVCMYILNIMSLFNIVVCVSVCSALW